LTVSALALPAQAQRVQSNVVLVRADDVIAEDLYAAGNTIIVSGTIQGDLVAIAFDSIRIDGVVEGDVIAISTSVEITGRVDGAVRVLSGSVSIDGAVDEDLFAGTLTLQAAPASNVGRDVLAWARTVELLGDVGRNVEGTHARTRIAGTVSGDVDVTTGGLALLPGANIVGDLRYTSDDEAVVAETAQVGGTLVRAEALAPNLRVRGIRLLVQLVGMISALGIGIGILWAAPNRSLAAAGALVRAPLRSLAWGVGVASVPLALGIVTFGIVSITSLSSSGPVVLVLFPIALALAAIVFMGLLTTPVPLALAAGNRLRPAWSSYARYVAGFPLIVGVWLLPWVGGILIGILALAGLGSWLVADDPT
jgi:cytoskeletal protein CcmA (bactofilin family)